MGRKTQLLPSIAFSVEVVRARYSVPHDRSPELVLRSKEGGQGLKKGERESS